MTLDIKKNAPRYLKGDPTRIRQILLNLVDNAVKFTSEGSVILLITLDSLSEDDEPKTVSFIRFEVHDTGIGIPKIKQKKIFESFFQVNAGLTRQHSGTGLGLAICKQLVEKMKAQFFGLRFPFPLVNLTKFV